MDKTHSLSSPMVVKSHDVKNDSFRPCEKDEELLGPEVPYFSAIGTLLYLANCTHSNIAISINLLAIYNSAPTQRHWNVSNIYCIIFAELLIWAYFTQGNQSNNYLDM